MGKLLVANWKMNPLTESEAMKLARAEDKKNVVIAPPFPFLGAVKKILKHASLGAQDVFYEEKGAYTGEVSPEMLTKLGVTYVIVGHSERRRLGESDGMIAKKVNAGMDAGLKIILCVGEPKWESGVGNKELGIRNQGLQRAKNYIKQQLLKDLRSVHNSKFLVRDSLVVAYEPIWAIGTGKNASPEEAAEMAKCIRQFLDSKFLIRDSRVLYGGSTNSRNAKSFLEKKEVDGLLVGGASIDPKEFVKMVTINSSMME